MINVEATGIFPLPLFKFKLGRDFSDEELFFIKNSELVVRPENTSGVSQTRNTFILNESPLVKLKEFIETSVAIYFDEVMKPYPGVNLRVTQSWVNFLTKGHSHHAHCHTNSYASGVLYIDTKDDFIHFFKGNTFLDHTSATAFNFGIRQGTPFNATEYNLKVEKGDLLIFPSNIMHFVNEVKEDRTRVSLSFNTFPKGFIGEKERYNYLEL